MQLIFTGRRRQAALLARILRKAGIDAVFVFAAEPGQGSVFVPDDDAGDQLTIERAIEASEIEYDAEGGAS